MDKVKQELDASEVKVKPELDQEHVTLELPEDTDEIYEEEPTTWGEYLAGACTALNSLSEVDGALLTKNEAQRMNRAKRKCRKIIYYIIEQYADELGL